MSADIKVSRELRVLHIEGSRETPYSFKPSEMEFKEVPVSVDGKGRSFMWAKKLKHLHGDANIYIVVIESEVEGSIDNVQITLKDCEILEFPKLEILSSEDAE